VDIIRNQQKSKFKLWWIAAGVAGLVLVGGFIYSVYNASDYRVERNTLRLASVNQGNFDIIVRAPGTLVPTQIRWLAAEANGRVERVIVKPGAQVKEGDLIAELSNPELEQIYDELQWDMEAMQAQNSAEIKDLESALLDQRSIELEAKSLFQSSELTLNAQTFLRERNQGSISKIEYESIQMQTAQRKERWEIEQSRTKSMKENVNAQITAKNARIKKLEKQILRAKQQVDQLYVRATMESVVQEVAIEPGQQLVQGANIAKLVQQDQLIARMLVPEIQIQQVALGQQVNIDTRNNRVAGLVSRISPSVVNGTVEVDIEFSEPLPSDARPDLTIDGEIMVAALNDALFVERPAYSQNFRKMRVFKVSEDGKFADKVLVEFGRGSASKIEIVSGLKPKDTIIVSDQSELDSYSRLHLTL
jgi:HlyD family secretion protein